MRDFCIALGGFLFGALMMLVLSIAWLPFNPFEAEQWSKTSNRMMVVVGHEDNLKTAWSSTTMGRSTFIRLRSVEATRQAQEKMKTFLDKGMDGSLHAPLPMGY